MRGLLRRLRGRDRPPPPEAGVGDQDLERYFTDAKEARELFDGLVEAERLEKRIVVVWGVGAVGKTSLLRMYRLACRRRDVAVALVGAEETPAAADLFERWAADLRAQGVGLRQVEDSLRRYRSLQAQVEEEARKLAQAEAEASDELGELAARTMFQAAASAIPVVGPFVGAVGSEAAGALINRLRASLSRADFDFYTDPTPTLSHDFLSGLAEVARRRRVVLMLDTYERITTLDDCLRSLVQHAPSDVLFVVAGRAEPDWSEHWPGWIAGAERIELHEMDKADVERLVRQYYGLFGRGEPSPEQVKEVVEYARGLPLAATIAVELLVRYRLETFEAGGVGPIADLAKRLLEGVPDRARPAFEAAAVLRWFNADSLSALLDGADARAAYEELRQWPFTRPRQDGLAVHDRMREVMNEALRARSPTTFQELNRRAAAHYEGRLERAGGEERERLGHEWLYHSVVADELAGMRGFQQMAEELVRYQWVARLRSLLTDAATYPLQESASRLWRRYYEARLDQLEGRAGAAEAEYRAIAADGAAEPKLRAYAYCDLGILLVAFERLAEPGGEARAVEAIERSFEAQPELDAKLVANHGSLMDVSNTRADWAESLEHLRPVREFVETTGDPYAAVLTDQREAAIHGLTGDWEGYLRVRERVRGTMARLGDVPALRMQAAYFTWPLVFVGRCREAQESSEEALELADRLEEKELMVTVLESVGLALGARDAFDEAAARFVEAENFYENVHAREAEQEGGTPERYIRAMLSFRGYLAMRQGRLDDAESDLRRALDIKLAIGDRIGTPEVHTWRAQVLELRRDWDGAKAEYQRVLDLSELGRRYFESCAHGGLARVLAQLGDVAAAGAEATSAIDLAERYGYHDVLAHARLTAGHDAWAKDDFDAAEALYREAVLHALRFNRLLLDEVVSGRAHGALCRPIVAVCGDRDEEGRRMLKALATWWRSGTDAEGTALPQAERTTRGREPGGSRLGVAEQLDSAV